MLEEVVKENSKIEYLTPNEVAQILKVQVGVVYDYLNEGKLKGFKIGGSGPRNRWRIKSNDVMEFVEGQNSENKE